MKKIILFTTLLIIATATFSQQNNLSPVLTKEDYLKKSKHQKTTAWSLLGAGIITGSIGTIIAAKEVVKITLIPMPGLLPPDEKKLNDGAALIVVGSTAILGRIPLFIASSRNKKKGMNLSFKNETAPQLQKSSFVYKTIPSLTLKISL
jgi:hypothetical protein